MKNSDIEILIKEHESGIKILNDIKSLNEDIEFYTYFLSGIKINTHVGLRKRTELVRTELQLQRNRLVNKYKLI